MKFFDINLKLWATICLVWSTNFCLADNFKVRVFYQDSAGIEAMLQGSVSSVSSPDFEVVYTAVGDNSWNDESALASLLVSTQKSDPSDGFLLACKVLGLDQISNEFRAEFPTVPFVDTFAPSLMAANIVSYRYAIFAGSENAANYAQVLVSRLGVSSHVRRGAGAAPSDDSLLLAYQDLELNADKSAVAPRIVKVGEDLTGSNRLNGEVINIEAMALVGCNGFLSLGVASEAASQLAAANIPLQVINPIKASMGLLYSLVRNKVWISSASEAQ